MTAKVFIDGAAGTTGLEIHDRLAGRNDIELIAIPEGRRKDPAARAEALNAADAVVLCLPDDAAREAVALIENPRVRIVDASTAHRTAGDWLYGFAELEPGQREALGTATRISNPGCYPSGFLALVRPLVRDGLLPADTPLSVNAVSGYSGGGKSMIAMFEDPASPEATDTAFRAYALDLGHKHVPEMQKRAGLSHPPIFCPSVARTYRGMLVEVPLHLHLLPGRPDGEAIRSVLAAAYEGSRVVRVHRDNPPVLTIEAAAGTDRLDLYVYADEKAGQARLIATLDNLGKGAAGAAVQNLNIALGLPETSGLKL
ncbi:N-acetyl-gamma-glutamyl-phosphate reductase [Rhizorhabdus dicambivorans]|uniref:N-acetyl-gamma-glutamyl-phosphate reductase n=1 Tax=Rhizorhabdus dicambivorans TaxID=1850238 RepID=A0A2A4FZI5_9SPHN|nr:N-acetyl-gamma-glutamyl-phosphate reductase [Rhizorhabdus dicambivorans]ATE64943.1 N-acetyl-gamma-glutamyl-phosphate reductase [Rhizorhabdus dicambivorans]PCE44217.1 N-acetyl-gamma-glutamyl-phosphate reductase [Rhizorhabdus dicambivorans]